MTSCSNLVYEADCRGDSRYKPTLVIGQRKKTNRTPQIIIKDHQKQADVL